MSKRLRKKTPSCKHIDAVIDYMSSHGVYVTAREAPSFFCAVCKVEREMNAHGTVTPPEKKP